MFLLMNIVFIILKKILWHVRRKFYKFFKSKFYTNFEIGIILYDEKYLTFLFSRIKNTK